MPYTKKIWQRNEIITEDGLNHIETGIEANDTAIKKALQRDIVEANIQKVGSTETSRAEIVQKENGSSLNLIISKDVDENIIQTEEGRVRAEEKRVEAEQSRVLAEAERKKSETARVLSENKRQQDTSAAIAKTEEATQAAVAKAQTATDNATTAANKAEAAVAKLPLPLGNTLKGEVEATLVNVDDAYPAPVLKAKVLGQSNQVTTTGKNLLGGERYVSGYDIRGFKNILKPNTQYTYSNSGITDGTAAFKLLAFNAEQSKVIELTVGYIRNASETFTTPENIGEFEELYLGGNYNDAGKNCINNFFQIEEGAKATSYEPYTGGKPSPSPDYPQEITNLTKAELVVAGRNLVEQSTTSTNALNRYSSCLFIEANLMPSTNYVLSFNDVVGNGYYINEALFSNFHAFTTKSGRNVVKLSTKAEISKANTGQYNEQGWIILKNDKNQDKAPAFTDVQIELGDTATAYEPHQSNSTPIDLKGNELCSLPNGVKDEVVIDAEGDVSLIKRVAKIDASTVNLEYIQKQNNNKWLAFKQFPNITSANATKGAISSKFIHKYRLEDGAQYGNFTITIDGNLCFGIPESLYPKEGDWVSVTPEVNAWFDGLKEGLFIYALYKNPQTIPLGKVELPALPEATSNVWNDGNIPANVYIQYLKDVNIAYGKLESQLSQITMALSTMDTPTVIPEISEDEPTLIPELEESPIEESSI